MRKSLNIIRFQEEIPSKVRFEFDFPLPKDGKFGKSYFYGVFSDSVSDAGFYATEKLNNLLQTIGNLRGRWLEIEKKQTDNGKSYWIIKENDEDITPSEEDVRNHLDSLDKKDQVQEDIEDLKMRVYDLEKAVKNLTGGIY